MYKSVIYPKSHPPQMWKYPGLERWFRSWEHLSQSSSQHQYNSGSQPSLALVPGDTSYSTLWSLQVPGTQIAHIITCRENTHRHKINLKFLKITFMCVFPEHMQVHHMYAQCSRGQKLATDTLELKSQMVVCSELTFGSSVRGNN